MKRTLKFLGWLDYRGRVDWEEIRFDSITIGVIGAIVWLAL